MALKNRKCTPGGANNCGQVSETNEDDSESETDDYQMRRMQSPDQLKKQLLTYIPDSD